MVNRRQHPQGQHPQGQQPQQGKRQQQPQQGKRQQQPQQGKRPQGGGNPMRNCHVCKTTHHGSRKDHDETERHLMVLMTRNCRNLQEKVKNLEDEKRLNKNRYKSMRDSINRLEREMDEINRYRDKALAAIIFILMFIFICLILIR